MVKHSHRLIVKTAAIVLGVLAAAGTGSAQGCGGRGGASPPFPWNQNLEPWNLEPWNRVS